MGQWLFFYALTIFCKVYFPVHVRQVEIGGYTKYIHIASIIITLILSTIPAGVAFGTGGFVVYGLTPGLTYCIGRNTKAYFYSYILPLCALLAFGMMFIILTLWRILRMRLHRSVKVWILCNFTMHASVINK